MTETIENMRNRDLRGPFTASGVFLYGKCASQQASVSHAVDNQGSTYALTRH